MFRFVAMACVVTLTAWFSLQTVAAQKGDKPVLKHIVLYKFKDSLTQEQVDEVIKTFNALPSKIPVILGYEAGTNVSKEGKSEGLTHSFVLTFKNMEDLDAYIAHPAHQAYVDIVKTRREKVVVFDYWVK
jgi:hypothetical protein